MKKITKITITILVFLAMGFDSAYAYSRVGGYTQKNGTYVMPYYKTSKDSSTYNNWSSKGNGNPFTGKKGSKNW